MNLINIIYKASRRVLICIKNKYDWGMTWWHFKGNNVMFSSFISRGIPYVMVAKNAKMSIGENLFLNNGLEKNPIGYSQRCTLFVDSQSEIIIGKNVGISQSALISTCSIKIGNNVKIGGGCHLYTTDFHSLNARTRKSETDRDDRINEPIIIEDNVFIGAGTTILKGVSIGSNSIIGAASLVTKHIPANQIWAGNPARFIKNIEL